MIVWRSLYHTTPFRGWPAAGGEGGFAPLLAAPPPPEFPMGRTSDPPPSPRDPSEQIRLEK